MGELYLLYGDDEAAINETKLKLLNRVITPEERDSNMTEFTPPANRFKLSLKKVLPPLTAELSTVSMFKDTARVAIVHNLETFYSRKGGGQSGNAEKSLDTFVAFLDRQFKSSPNVLFFICTENPDKGRWVVKSSPLFDYLKKNGTVRMFRSRLRDAFIDSLLARNTPKAIEAMRSWWERTKSPAPEFFAMVTTVELLLQAKLVTDTRRYALSEKDLKNKFLKRSLTVSIFKEYYRRKNKIMAAAPKFTMRELTRAMERLLEIGVYVFPQQTDKYVPDIKVLLEQFVIEFTTGSASRVS